MCPHLQHLALPSCKLLASHNSTCPGVVSILNAVDNTLLQHLAGQGVAGDVSYALISQCDASFVERWFNVDFEACVFLSAGAIQHYALPDCACRSMPSAASQCIAPAACISMTRICIQSNLPGSLCLLAALLPLDIGGPLFSRERCSGQSASSCPNVVDKLACRSVQGTTLSANLSVDFTMNNPVACILGADQAALRVASARCCGQYRVQRTPHNLHLLCLHHLKYADTERVWKYTQAYTHRHIHTCQAQHPTNRALFASVDLLQVPGRVHTLRS